MLGLPILCAAIWGTSRVPGDAGASGRALAAVTGWLRLLIGPAFFASGTWGLFNAGAAQWGRIFGIVTLFQYIISYDRLGWLSRR